MFRIYDTISSGSYLLRAYAKWMLNYSEDLFFYKTVTIINPFKNIEYLPISQASRDGGAGLLPLLPEITDYYIDINQSFCSTFNRNKPSVFFLDSSLTESINKAVISMQINNIYEQVRLEKQLRQLPAGKGNFFGIPDKSVKISDYSSDALKASRIPDFRNTLYWNPDSGSADGNHGSVEFYTSDEAGMYTVVVEGRSADGKTGFSTTQLLVK